MGQQHLNYERVAQAIDFLGKNFRQQPDLTEVARQVHLSPEHFQRIFTEWAGVSPKKFMQFLTLDFLRDRIYELPNLQAAADEAGLSAQSRVYDLFVNIEGVTPGAFREGGMGLHIHYGYHNTPFGLCFIAVADRGVCALSFVDEDRKRTEFDVFQQKWHFAELQHAPEKTQPVAQQIFSPEKNNLRRLTVLAQGTNFQMKVWEALLRIPPGAVTTYSQIARSIGNPAAVRAVGSAVGSNPVGFLIPCHRVIQSTGKLGGYHWGEMRKSAIVGWEMARHEV
ncbi:MAG: methylated-DNA--[protein]-cysteine S-methyltransferase [Haliscomenobacteraceae bacterium CHB4]|nr:Bifunctional transcriptional activator/DNA repair enzyme Ada [Saprospiraceae bacterium]MCE7922892.1 methylated-DNA--[protein]-cysteine S-methyltransferase [Haliscomenobacteraceae bacterium CHB4]